MKNLISAVLSVLVAIGLGGHWTLGFDWPASPDPRSLVVAAVDAMGGETALRAVRGVRFEGVGHTYVTSIALHPAGPQPVMYEQISQLTDITKLAVRRTTITRLSFRPGEFRSVLVVGPAGGSMESGGRVAAAPAASLN